ncbi:MAG: thioredoxin family protein [Bacteroidaceae bacterium]|nr:thioredoxin family protein [Bacteroidaceae bacterium]
MKKILLFYQERCPFCKRAFAYLEELKEENSLYSNIEIESIDELNNPEYADKFDYYYVPTFYIGEEKVHEGGIKKEELRDILDKSLK